MREGAGGPRLPLLAQAEATAAAEAEGLPAMFADLSVFRVLLHHPLVAHRYSDFLMDLLWRGRLDARLRELVIMRLGWATGSVYEWTQHWRVATDLHVDEADLLGVRDWEHHDAFGPAERAVLSATDETLATGAVTDATWRACVDHVSEDPQVLIELVSAIGLWRMISGVLRTLAVPLEDGVSAWPPDGKQPG